MAKDMLDAVCAAEEEAASREEKALEKAADTAEQAKKEAAELTRKRRKAAEQKSADELEKSKAELEQKSKAAKAEAEKACGDISALADKNRKSVIAKAAELILKWRLGFAQVKISLTRKLRLRVRASEDLLRKVSLSD